MIPSGRYGGRTAGAGSAGWVSPGEHTMSRTTPLRRARHHGAVLALSLLGGSLAAVGVLAAPPSDAAAATVTVTMDCTTNLGINGSGSETITSSFSPAAPGAGAPIDVTIEPGPPTLPATVNLNSIVITTPIPTQINPASVSVTFANGSTPANLTGSAVVQGSNAVLTFTGNAVPSTSAVLAVVTVHATVKPGTAGQTLTLGSPSTVTANAKLSGLTVNATCTPNAASPTVMNSAAIVAVPGAPALVSASPGNAAAKVSWWAPAANGSPITGYTVTPLLGGVAQAPRTFTTPATSQVITGLTNGSTYTFKVTARNANGAGPASIATNAALVGAPSTPGNVVGSPGNGQAKVTWVASTPNASPLTGYVITPYLAGVAQAPASAGPGATSQTISGLANGTTYTFKVSAQNATGSSPAVVTAAIKVGTPTAPVLVTARSGNNQATVSWWPSTANGSALTSYVVTPYVAGVAKPAQTFAAASNSVTVTGLTNGTIYTFKVYATNAVGAGPASVPTPAVKVGTALAPTAVSATAGSAQATVHWTAGAANGTSVVTGYVVTPYVAGLARPAQTFASTATTQTLVGLTNGTTYTFKVAAINAIGTGLSATASAAVTPA